MDIMKCSPPEKSVRFPGLNPRNFILRNAEHFKDYIPEISLKFLGANCRGQRVDRLNRYPEKLE